MKTKIILSFVSFSLLSNADTKPTIIYPPVPDEIKTSDYHDYTGCKLLRVDPDGVVITHKLGVAKLMFTSMPVNFQKAYGYDPVAAKKAQDDEIAREAAAAAQAKAYNAQIAQEASIPSSITPKPSATPQEQLAAVSAQLASLQNDLAEKQKLLSESALYHSNNPFGGTPGATHGAFDDAIVYDQQQITALTAQQRALQGH